MEELAIIEELDRRLDEWAAGFETGLLVVNRQVLEGLDGLLESLVLRGRATSREEYRANLRLAVLLEPQLRALILERAGLNGLVQALVENMGKSADLVSSYYSALVGNGFTPEPYQAFLARMTEQYRALLTTGAVEGVFSPVLMETINTHVLTRSTGAELRAVLRTKLGEGGVIARTVHQQASDALYIYSRAYAAAVAEDLKLEHYYYMGTQISTTRSFCASRIAKAYTQKEVEQWANLSWSGKIPGTTRQSIFWLLGGYNCRHRLIPISKELYNQFQTKQQVR